MSRIKPLCVTEGLRDLMKNLTKEILKKKPLNIYEFSANYFESMIEEQEVYNKHQNFEAILNYETTIIKISTVSLQPQVPLSLLHGIVPEKLFELIKEFIKAVLRTNPDNIFEFAVQYFNQLKEQHYGTNCLVEYGSYENYLKTTQEFSTYTDEKCTCGRFLTQRQRKEKVQSDLNDPRNSSEIRHLDLSTFNTINNQEFKTVKLIGKNNTKIICELDMYMQKKYISAIVIIQRFFRHILRLRKPETRIIKEIVAKEIGEPSNTKVSLGLTYRDTSSCNNENFRDTNLPKANKGNHISLDDLTTCGVKDKINIRALPKDLGQNEDITAVYANKKDFEQTDDVKQAFSSAPKSETECEPIDGIPDISKLRPNGESFNNLFFKENVSPKYETSHNNLDNMEDLTPQYESKHHSGPTDNVKEAFTPDDETKNECQSILSISDFSKPISRGNSLNNLAFTEVVITEYENQNSSQPTDDIKETVASAKMENPNPSKPGDDIKKTHTTKHKSESEVLNDLDHTEDVTSVFNQTKNSKSTGNVDIAFISQKNYNEYESLDKISDISRSITQVPNNLAQSIHDNTNHSEPVYNLIGAHKYEVHAEAPNVQNKDIVIVCENYSEYEPLDKVSDILRSTTHGEVHNNLATSVQRAHTSEVQTITPKNFSQNKDVAIVRENIKGFEVIDNVDAFTSETEHGNECEPVDSISEVSQPLTQRKSRINLANMECVTTVYENKNHSEPIADIKEALIYAITEENELKSIDSISDISQFMSYEKSRYSSVNKVDVPPQYRSEPIDDTKEAFTSEVKTINTIDATSDFSKSITSLNNLPYKEVVITKHENQNHSEPTDDIKESTTSAMDQESENEAFNGVTNISKPIEHEESLNNLASKEVVITGDENQIPSLPSDDIKETVASTFKEKYDRETFDGLTDISKPITHEESLNNMAYKQVVQTKFENQSHPQPGDDIKETKTSTTKLESEGESFNDLDHSEGVSPVLIQSNSLELTSNVKRAFISEIKNYNEYESLDKKSNITRSIFHGKAGNNLATTIHGKNNSEPIYNVKGAHTSEVQDEAANNLTQNKDITIVSKNKKGFDLITKVETFTSEAEHGNECEPIESIPDISQPLSQRESGNNLDNTLYENKNHSEPTLDVKEVFTSAINNGNRPNSVNSISNIAQPKSYGKSRNNLVFKEDITPIYANKKHFESNDNVKEACASQIKNDKENESVDNIADISKFFNHGVACKNLILKKEITTVDDNKNQFEPTCYVRCQSPFEVQNEAPNHFTQSKDKAEIYDVEKGFEPIDVVKEALIGATENKKAFELIESISSISQPLRNRESRNTLANKEIVTTVLSESDDDAKNTFLSALKIVNECEPFDSIPVISKLVPDGESPNNMSYKKGIFAGNEVNNYFEPTNDVKEAITSAKKLENESESLDGVTNVLNPITKEESGLSSVHTEDITTILNRSNNSESTDNVNDAFAFQIKNYVDYESNEEIFNISRSIANEELLNNAVTPVNDNKKHFERIYNAKEPHIFEEQKEAPNNLMQNKAINKVYENTKDLEPINDVIEALTGKNENINICESIDSISDLSKPALHGQSLNNMSHKEGIIAGHENQNISEPTVDVNGRVKTAMKEESESESVEGVTDILNLITRGKWGFKLVHTKDITTVYENTNHSEPIDDANEAFTSAMKNANECANSVSENSKPVSQEPFNNVSYMPGVADDNKKTLTSSMKQESECEPTILISDISNPIAHLVEKKNESLDQENTKLSELIDYEKGTLSFAVKLENKCVLVDGLSVIPNPKADEESINDFVYKASVTPIEETKSNSEPLDLLKEDFKFAVRSEIERELFNGEKSFGLETVVALHEQGKTILLENEHGKNNAQELSTFVPSEKMQFEDARDRNFLQSCNELNLHNCYESTEAGVSFEHLLEFTQELSSESIKEHEQNENNKIVNMATKLREVDELLKQMQQQQHYKRDCFGLDNDKEEQEGNFRELVISLMDNLLERQQSDSEDEMILADNDETCENSALNSQIIGQECQTEQFDYALIAKRPCKSNFTFASDILEPPLECETSPCDLLHINVCNNIKDHNSLYLDEITSENIRLKMLASSLSESEPHIFEVGTWNQTDSNNRGSELLSFNISATLTDTVGTSSDTESTIIFAAAKPSSENEVHEILPENHKKIRINAWDGAQAAARRMTFQRGNALRNDSILDERQFFNSKDENWNLFKQKSELYSNEHNITEESLKFMQSINELFPKELLGRKIIFEQRLKEWQIEQGVRVEILSLSSESTTPGSGSTESISSSFLGAVNDLNEEF
ncbi:uncharacterized protein LOC105233704 isoform X4 [Bactrocera dorsalis]|uniref:Uncharacterized protein LOC105233704 isoform X4 n=1 Tax=Bactrocera dorsalis TaxID=27457 RepID=A0ABM3J3Y2_BACDO|nr:uncharacterized protein LOC105233704 isoform X4 [Bactrocera dorsalis]